MKGDADEMKKEATLTHPTEHPHKGGLNRIKPFDILVYVLLALFTLICLLPLLNTLAISFSDRTSAALGQVYILPKNFTLIAYEEMVKDNRYFTAFGVSLLRVALGCLINVTVSILMAYPLSRSRKAFRARNVYMWLLVFCMMFNGGLIPNYLLIKQLGLMDTIWALVLPGAVPVFSVVILMNFFKGIPNALEEAALVDGATPPYILFRIYVPLAKASIATIALFSVVGHWNAYFDGKIYINTAAKQPLQTYLQALSAELSMSEMANLQPEEIIRRMQLSDITFNSAKAMFSMIPILLIYPFLQKYFVTGMVMGSVKE